MKKGEEQIDDRNENRQPHNENWFRGLKFCCGAPMRGAQYVCGGIMTKVRRDELGDYYTEYRDRVNNGECPVTVLASFDWLHPVRLAQLKKYIQVVERGSMAPSDVVKRLKGRA